MKGFSLVELLTVVAILAVLSAMGVHSYKTHTARARQAGAKQALSFVWQAENGFKKTFKFYHENLIAIGAIPSGTYHYDVGFGTSAVFETDSKILSPFPLPEMLDVRECTNYYQICKNNECIKEIENTLDNKTDSEIKAKARNFNTKTKTPPIPIYRTWCNVEPACTSSTDPCLKHWTGTGDQAEANAKADKDTFKAFAIGKVAGSIDVWSITETQTIEHEK